MALNYLIPNFLSPSSWCSALAKSLVNFCMSCAASGKGIHRPLKSRHEEAVGHQYRAKVLPFVHSACNFTAIYTILGKVAPFNFGKLLALLILCRKICKMLSEVDVSKIL